MFQIFSRSKKGSTPDFSVLKTDMHSHLIPGIDDGAASIEVSLELIRGMMDLGYSTIITTPHIMWDMYKNNAEVILSGLETLKAAVKTKGWQVELHAAAEYFLDDHVAQLLKDKTPLLTVRENWVLSEFSMAFPSHSLKDILFEMQMQGYQPVIAHPERYIYLERDKEFYEDLKNTGCFFQLNLLSLTGYYGKAPQELANYLMKKGYYDLVGTDLHGHRHLEALQQPELSKVLKQLMDSGRIRNPQI